MKYSLILLASLGIVGGVFATDVPQDQQEEGAPAQKTEQQPPSSQDALDKIKEGAKEIVDSKEGHFKAWVDKNYDPNKNESEENK